MKLSVSNIAWPVEKTQEILPKLKNLGVEGIELAPTKIWPDIYKVGCKDTVNFIKEINRHGLKIVGFHALLFGQKNLSIFGTKEILDRTMEYLLKLSEICSWLGGRTLVFGSPQCRRRSNMLYQESIARSSAFFYELAEKCKRFDVIFVIEPLGKSETDFIDSAVSAIELIKKVNHPNFQGHLDAKALAESNEISEDIFKRFKPFLCHFHVNDPNLAVIDKSDKIGHSKIGKLLKMIEYDKFISLEQRTDIENPIESCLHSVRVIKEFYES